MSPGDENFDRSFSQKCKQFIDCYCWNPLSSERGSCSTRLTNPDDVWLFILYLQSNFKKGAWRIGTYFTPSIYVKIFSVFLWRCFNIITPKRKGSKKEMTPLKTYRTRKRSLGSRMDTCHLNTSRVHSKGFLKLPLGTSINHMNCWGGGTDKWPVYNISLVTMKGGGGSEIHTKK